MIGCLPTQTLAFPAVFVYATHATQAIAFEWKPGLTHVSASEDTTVIALYKLINVRSAPMTVAINVIVLRY